MAHGSHGPSHGDAGHAERHIHVVPVRTLATVFAALAVLTVITVGVTYVDLGPANLFIALGIAVLKAALVALIFMHLKWDAPMNAFVFICSAFFVMLFIGICLMDTNAYKPNQVPGYSPAITQPK